MDKYQRLRKIGEGAFGKAFLVRHKGSNRQCVVKEINIVKMSPKEREEARKEVAVLAQLKHPNIVAYIESFEESGTLHIVMNYCAGGDLYSKINSQRGMLFPEEQIWNWFVQICLALKHIHDRKILHRDIKSQNIFLTMNGVVQLGDFGIAKVLNNTVELAKTCIGTPYYLSPEIVENKPYNNKSDIWSLGCVLYELTTHKHAFEAGNMKNLVLKIIRGSYPPIPPQYSYDLRGLIAQLLKRGPRDRPSINSVLQKNFIMQRVRSLLSAEVIADEFSHTVMHGAKVAKVLPPGPRPSSAPKKEVLQRPGSAGRKYDPTPVYGRPLSARKSQGRSSGELKKKAAGGGGRPLPVPGQLEWGQKKKEMLDKEQKHREEIKKQQQDEVAQRHRNFVEKQKMDRINKSREEGWKNLIDQPEGKKDMPQSPHAGGDARPLPLPKQQPDPGQPNFLENRKPRQPGNYEDYHAYLDKLKNQRLEREKALDQRSAEYMVAIKVPAQQNNGGNNSDSGPQGWNPTPAVLAVQQANYNRQMAEQAAERAKLVEDYMIRRREAAKNKARGQAELFGHRPPSGAGRPSPIPRPRQERPQVKPVRNKEEEEYLEKLQQIREQNWHERRAIRKKMGDDDHIAEKKEKEAEERRKKKEALKQQADDWAKKKRDELEQERQKLLNSQIVAGDKAKQPPVAPPSRPSSAKARMRPAPAVPITGVLQVIGAGVEAASPVPGKAQLVPPAGEPEVLQQKKQEILKKLNQQTPARGKWGAGGVEVPSAEAVEMRGKWGRQAASPLAVMQAETPEPESSRSQWDKEEKLRLSNLPLEQTASQMEVTSARDQVIKNPGSVGETPPSARNQWGRPGSTVVKALNKLPVYEGTVTLDNNSSQEGAENSASAGNTPPVIGSTVTLSKAPAPGPAPPPIPSVRPPVRSGTITIKAADTAPSPTPTPSEDIQKPGVVEGKDVVAKATLNILAAATGVPVEDEPQLPVGEAELPGSNRFVQSSEEQEATEKDSALDRLETVLEVTELGLEAEQSISKDTRASCRDEMARGQGNSPPEQPAEQGQSTCGDLAKSQSSRAPAASDSPKIPPKPRPLPKPNLLPKPETPIVSSDVVAKATLNILAAATGVPVEDEPQLPVGEAELPGSNRFVQFSEEQKAPEKDSALDRLETVLEVTELGLEAEQSISKDTRASCHDEMAQGQGNSPPEQPAEQGQSTCGDLAKSQSSGAPAASDSPKIPPKPRPLPKPNLLPKPETPIVSSEQDPGAAANAEGQGLTGGPDKKEQADGSRKGDLIIEDRSHSVQKGLTTGNYDIRDVQLLRTCSEPDLTRLFRGTVKCVQATLQRPQSLEMEQETESQSEDSSQESEEEAKAKAAGNVAAAENEVLAEKGDNNDEDCNEFSDDEEEELMNLRATMQSLLIDNDDDAGTPPIGKVKFNLSGSVESTLKVEEDKVIEEEEKSQTTEKTKAGEDAVVQPVLSKGSPIRSKSDSVLVERCEPGDGGDNQEGEETEDELDYNVAEIFNMNDSDDETIFGDDDGDDDLDLYSRLEQQRAELERELGFDKFVQVYKTVQALQEDEDENMEEGARIAIDMLGQDKQHLYPRIFQLVMADTAFTEDNV